MNEFTFIRDHLAAIAGEGAEQLSDDCAWLPLGEGWLALSTDTSIEGVHFPKGMRGASATERAVRVALSDIAAKAATPVGVMVNLSLPNEIDPKWMTALAKGLSDASAAFDVPLLGGDTTRYDGPLVISVTVLGRVQKKILRSGAGVGQHVFLTGPIGDAALGLRYVQGASTLSNPTGEELYVWEEAYLRPEPAFAYRDMLEMHALASIDISDGLIADAGHVAKASAVQIVIEADAIPLSNGSRRYVGSNLQRLVELATAGDDYCVLFTSTVGEIEGCVRIGHVTTGEGVTLLTENGAVIDVPNPGYEH